MTALIFCTSLMSLLYSWRSENQKCFRHENLQVRLRDRSKDDILIPQSVVLPGSEFA